MEVAGPLGTPLGLAQRKRASPRGHTLPSQPSLFIQALGHKPLSFLRPMPQTGALEPTDRTPPESSWGYQPSAPFLACQGAPPNAGVGLPPQQDPGHRARLCTVQRQQVCNGKLFLALACSLLLISCPCDPGNALLPQASTPRLESLFLAPQEPSCLCHAVEVGATQSCLSEATGWPAQTSRPRLVTNLPHLFQSALMAFGGEEAYPEPARDKQAHFGASLPEETSLPALPQLPRPCLPLPCTWLPW